ncbi:MAG: ectonucleotide pyrophosphatase/phosphodiesterase [Bacteriovoracales bacterium]|nr:ectonucleotide pyrophosphatase/phosphodiesterase [Bacteriovoracales bacterium]
MMTKILFYLCTLSPWALAVTQIEENHPRFDKTPYVLLISIDGYRHDYNELYRPPTLIKLAEEGVKAKSLIPVFPILTFPNHLSLITGRYPARHGIVANRFYAPKLKKAYSYKNPKAVTSASFYSGVPLWNLASMNQMVSAIYFWPGSEAPIGGHFPSHYMPYKGSTPHKDRIDKVIEWFKLPLRKRPHFVSLYFSDVDSAGHDFGPESKEVKKAVLKVDSSLKDLFGRLDKLGLELNIIVTSDHGMGPVDQTKKIFIDKSPKIKKLLKSFRIYGMGSGVFFYYKGKASKKSKAVKTLMQELSKSTRFYKAYRSQNLPARFHAKGTLRMGDIIVMAEPPYFVGTRRFFGLPPKGIHGYETNRKEMHGIFMARGPGLKKNLTVPGFESIHVYPLIAKLLGLSFSPQSIDGDFLKVKGLLADR